MQQQVFLPLGVCMLHPERERKSKSKKLLGLISSDTPQILPQKSLRNTQRVLLSQVLEFLCCTQRGREKAYTIRCIVLLIPCISYLSSKLQNVFCIVKAHCSNVIHVSLKEGIMLFTYLRVCRFYEWVHLTPPFTVINR